MKAKVWVAQLLGRRLKIVILLLLAASLVTMLYDLSFESLLGNDPGKIILNGHRNLQKEEILEMLGITEHTKLKELNIGALEKKLKMHPRVKDASISLRAKGQLLVTIHERKALYIVNSNDTLYEIDEDAYIISTGDIREKDLVVLSGEFPIHDGAFQGSRLKDFKNSLDTAFKLYPELWNRVSEASLQVDGNIILYIQAPRNLKVFTGSHLDKMQVRKLYSSLAYFENQNVDAYVLDLRGDDAVFQ
jgi:cell division protein FtsQ